MNNAIPFPTTRRTVTVALLSIALTLATVLRFSIFEAAAQDSASFAAGDPVAVNTDDLNLRDAGTTSSNVLTVLPYGAFLTVVSGPETVDDIDWYLVDADGTEGYVAGEYLIADASFVFAADDLVIVNTGSLNLRSDASASADILSTLVFGQGATILAGPTNADGYDWYQVDVDGTTGFVARDFIAYDVATTGDTAETSAPADGTSLFVNTDTLNIRDTPSTTGGVLETLTFGDTVTVSGAYSTADGYTWAELTTADGTTGYGVADYLTDDEAALLLQPGAAATVNDAELNLRATAGLNGEILATLTSGDALTIISASESIDGYLWYQVETEAGTGWVAGMYLVAS